LLSDKNIKSKNKITSNFDYIVLFTVIMLVSFGVIMIFSASSYIAATRAEYNCDMFLFLKKQLFAVMLGFLGMLFATNFNYKRWQRLSVPLYVISNLLLIFAFLFGVVRNGAKRWINIPIIGSFQPSELSKVSIILFVSYLIANNKNILNGIAGHIFCGIFVGITVVLIAIGNLSTAIIVTLIGTSIIFVASPYTAVFLILSLLGSGGLVTYIAFFAKNFRGARFAAWLNPFSDPSNTGYQIIQSLYAVASGGMFGLGLGQSRQKLGFIPEAHNDIIFSVVCEELGFFGASVILLLFSILIWRGIKISVNAKDLFGTLVACGIVVMLASQVVINVAVVTNSIPNTGVPLPFISYGGTSIAIVMTLVGILLNISKN
jgi:cell division protein FtsW